MLPSALESNHVLVDDQSVSRESGNKETRPFPAERPPSTPGRTESLSRTYEMKSSPIISKCRIHTRYSYGVTEQPKQDKTHKAKMFSDHLSSESTKQDDKPNMPEQMSRYKMPTMFSGTANTANIVEQSPERARAQQELQYMGDTSGGQDDPYAQDALGIGMLLQAAKVIEDRERAQETQTQIPPQVDGSSEPDVQQPASYQSDDDYPRFQDTSELDRLSNTHRTPRADMLIDAQSMRSGPATSTLRPRNEPHGHKRRRSERLVSTLSPMDLTLQPPSAPLERATKRARSEQPSSTSTHILTTAPKPITAESSTTPEPSVTSNTRQDMIVRRRIKAIRDKASAMSKGTWKPNFPPVVKEYIEEQRLRKEKTLLWLERQEKGEEPDEGESDDDDGDDEGDESEDEEDGRPEDYDEGVEDGIWIESSGSESATPQRNAGRQIASTNTDEARPAQRCEVQNSQSDPDDDDVPAAPSTVNAKADPQQHLTSHPTTSSAPTRHHHARGGDVDGNKEGSNSHGDIDNKSDSADDTITVHPVPSPYAQSHVRGRGRRRLVRGHRKSGSHES